MYWVPFKDKIFPKTLKKFSTLGNNANCPILTD